MFATRGENFPTGVRGFAPRFRSYLRANKRSHAALNSDLEPPNFRLWLMQTADRGFVIELGHFRQLGTQKVHQEGYNSHSGAESSRSGLEYHARGLLWVFKS